MASHPPPDMSWQEGIRRSRLFVMVWSDAAAYAGIQHRKLDYAMSLGKPIRLLVLEGQRVPEGLCAGYADVAVAHFAEAEHEAAQRQLMTWLEELNAREGHHG